jgi:malate synthase
MRIGRIRVYGKYAPPVAGFPFRPPSQRSRATNQLISHEILIMSDVEDYPGPTHNHPEKKGQNQAGRADEGMVKPSVNPEPKKEKPMKQKQKRR